MTLGVILGSCCLEQAWLAAAETLSHRRLRSRRHKLSAAGCGSIHHQPRAAHLNRPPSGSVCCHAFPTAPSRWADQNSRHSERKKMKNGSTPQVPSPSLPMLWLVSPSLDSHPACDLSVPQAIGVYLASRPGPCVCFWCIGAAERGMLH